MTMMIHSTMHLAHSFALLTAANEQDAEAMTRSLMKYEGWIMGATGVLHLIHAMSHAYEILAASAAVANAAMLTGLAPLTVIAAGIAVVVAAGAGLYAMWEGLYRGPLKAAEAAIRFTQALREAAAAQADFNKAVMAASFEGSEKKFAAENKTGNFGAGRGATARDTVEKLLETKADDAKLEEKEALKLKMLEATRTRQAQERKDLLDERREEEASHFHQMKKWGTWGLAGGHKGFEEDTKEKMAELEKRQQDEIKNKGEEYNAVLKERAALAQRVVEITASERDRIKENIKEQEQFVHSLQSAVRAAKEGVQSADKNFGSLNEAQQLELERINEKVKKKQALNVNERAHVRQYGGKEGNELIDEIEEDLGKKAGREKKTSHLKSEKGSPEEKEKTAKAQLADADHELKQMRQQLGKKERELAETGTKLGEIIDKVTETTTQIILDATKKMKEFEITLRRIKDNQK